MVQKRPSQSNPFGVQVCQVQGKTRTAFPKGRTCSTPGAQNVAFSAHTSVALHGSSTGLLSNQGEKSINSFS